ncbi:MAG: GatB/YqeY domain-containing protein [Thermodesulfobacteria bacterium]|nr:GatB/YqeY domain-containing protein [Thermodesulfobacteriota bacterium]
MGLFERIKKDMLRALKEDREKASLLKTILGEIQRDPDKDYSDRKVVKVIQKYLKGLEENLKLGAISREDYEKERSLLSAYLPQMVSEEEIRAFLAKLDFSRFKNKMQAVGEVIKHFGAERVDGKKVQEIVRNYEPD